METNKVYFLRHGESEWDRMKIFSGWHDVDLSVQGIYDVVLITTPAFVNENVTKFDVAFTSVFKQTIKTLEIIMNSFHLPNIKIHSNWRLNERHYGALIGFNKRQIANIYGEEMVRQWRNSYDKMPPPMTPTHAFYNHIKLNPRLQSIPKDQFPNAESLKATMHRVIPYWDNNIVPEIKNMKKILIVGHGNCLRALIQHIEKWNLDKIVNFTLPFAIPFCYEFDIKTMEKVGELRFLVDSNILEKAIERANHLGK